MVYLVFSFGIFVPFIDGELFIMVREQSAGVLSGAARPEGCDVHYRENVCFRKYVYLFKQEL